MLLGKETPRFCTPPLREITPETSLGFEAVEFIEESLGRPLHPWQKFFLLRSLELAPGSHTWDDYPVLRFETVLLLVARQNGKSYVMSSRALWRMFMWDGPEVDAPLILGTANKESTASEIKTLAVKALKASEELREEIVRDRTANGDVYFEVKNGARYRVEAANDDGGRGLSVTDLLFDELRQQRNWDAWTAMTNTTNAKFSSQTIAVSNAGEAKSVVLSSLRQKALDAIRAWDESVAPGVMSVDEYAGKFDTSLGLFEYSAPDGCDIWDREGWAQANPSLGHADENGVVLVSEKSLAAKAALVGIPGKGVPEHKYRTENLCQWVTIAEESFWETEDIEAVFALDEDEAGQISLPSVIDPASPLAVCFDVSHDRKTSWVGLAGWRTDGTAHVELIARRPGTEWVPKFIASGLAFTPDIVTAQGRGAPASSLIEYVEAEGVEVTRCEGTGLGASAGLFSDKVVAGKVRAPADAEALRMAMTEVRTKTLGEMFVFDRGKSPVDAAPVCAVSMALWALEAVGRAPEPATSAYADGYGGWEGSAEAVEAETGNEDDDERWW